MSRKDPRARMLVPVTAEDVAWLRARARGRSLGDALRRVVEAQIDAPVLVAPGEGGRLLTVQLPRRLRLRLATLARETGRDEAELGGAMLAQAVGSTGAPPPILHVP